MKRVTLNAVVRELRRRGIKFADDKAEAAKICQDFARDCEALQRKYSGKYGKVYQATYGTDLYSAYIKMSQILVDGSLFAGSIARKLK